MSACVPLPRRAAEARRAQQQKDGASEEERLAWALRGWALWRGGARERAREVGLLAAT
jgi:hypothetical protein